MANDPKTMPTLKELGGVPDVQSPAPQRPRYSRLSTDTWVTILREYVGGATVPQLVEKWGVAEATVRGRIHKHEATKAAWGDELANQRAESVTETERLQRIIIDRKRRRLFADFTQDDVVAPSALALLATVASGRAMLAQLWPEARVLVHLADAYARLDERNAVKVTLEDLLAIPDDYLGSGDPTAA